jgi:hypothetical protein
MLIIENIKNHLILALFIFNIVFWLHIANQKKRLHISINQS